MKIHPWLKSEIGYGEELIRAAMAGAQSAHKEPVHIILSRSARTCLPWMTIIASAGLLASYGGSKPKSARTIAAQGLLLGAAIGFGFAVALKSDEFAEESVRGAVKSINSVRDAHWLAKHPINYA